MPWLNWLCPNFGNSRWCVFKSHS